MGSCQSKLDEWKTISLPSSRSFSQHPTETDVQNEVEIISPRSHLYRGMSQAYINNNRQNSQTIHSRWTDTRMRHVATSLNGARPKSLVNSLFTFESPLR